MDMIRVRVVGTEQLVEAIPTLVGYRPAEALAAVMTRAGAVAVTVTCQLRDLDSDEIVRAATRGPIGRSRRGLSGGSRVRSVRTGHRAGRPRGRRARR
ncbi:hypothetical protein [Nocardia sp. GAS34]|uniref:hypothetical protein n=1 Tax=unclassified Nocardia TaxID=2637762 RepID=UPI003D1A1F35